MKIGLIGLGKMGQQINTRLRQANHEVVVLDPSNDAVTTAVAAGSMAASDRADLVQQLGEPAVIWLMIPAGAVEAELHELLSLTPRGSIIIDGGNSNYQQTIDHAKQAAEQGVELVDVGTSGGVLGLKNGFSMMVGGSKPAVATVTPIIEALAQPSGWRHFGPAGSGHFVKMVHNGVEYGIMQAYAEGYQLLHDTQDFPGLDLAAIAEVWQHGSIIESSLNALAHQVFQANPELNGIEGVVAESGEARWTVEAAQRQQLELPVIAASLDVRVASQAGKTSFATKVLAALRHAFGGHAINLK